MLKKNIFFKHSIDRKLITHETLHLFSLCIHVHVMDISDNTLKLKWLVNWCLIIKICLVYWWNTNRYICNILDMAWLNYKDLFPRYLISLYIFLERFFFKELLQNSCSKLQPMHHWEIYINVWNPLILQWIWSGTYQLISLNKIWQLCAILFYGHFP